MSRNDVTNQYAYSKFIVDRTYDNCYSTVQAGLDAAYAEYLATGINQVVLIRPGDYTENLTLYPYVNLHGVSSNVDDYTVNIHGIHTPPNSGICLLTHINFYGINVIFQSNAVSTCDIGAETCNFLLSGSGYVFDIPNFTYLSGVVNCGDLSANIGGQSGWMNNPTGGATIIILNSQVGEGNANTMQISGQLQCQLSDIFCPINLQGANTDSYIEHCDTRYNVTITDTAICRISDSTIESGVAQALTQNSTGTLRVSNLTVNSSNNPAIGGTGTINLGSVTFLDDNNIAGTVTLTNTSVLQTTDLQLNTAYNGSMRILDGRAGSITYQQCFYIGKHGLDTNAGTTPEYAVLTFAQGLLLAAALAPAANNRFVLICLDDGIYTENIACQQYCDIWAPNATLVGTIDLDDDINIKFRAQRVSTGTIGIFKPAIQNAYSFVEIDDIDIAGTGIGLISLSGFTNLIWKKMTIVNGFGIGDLTAALGHIHLKGGDIYISGTGTGIVRAFAGTTIGRLDHIIDIGTNASTGINCIDGTIDLQISRIESVATAITMTGGTVNLQVTEIGAATAAYNVGAAAILNLIVNLMAGTETNAGTLSLIRGDGSSYMNDISSSALTDRSRTQNTVSIYGVGGVLSGVGPLTDGQVVIGETGGIPVAANITSTDGSVDITNGAGSIDLSVRGANDVAFSAYNTGGDLNITGNYTDYKIKMDTEVFDIGSDFNVGTYEFTAPEDGAYQLSLSATATGITAAGTAGNIAIYTSNRIYSTCLSNPFNSMNTSNDWCFSGSFLCDMDSGDVAYGRFTIGGEGADICDLRNNPASNRFTGHLVSPT